MLVEHALESLPILSSHRKTSQTGPAPRSIENVQRFTTRSGGVKVEDVSIGFARKNNSSPTQTTVIASGGVAIVEISRVGQ